jgi:DNA-directed RNA polymerase subunit M/transcription elongation factor TFIIS
VRIPHSDTKVRIRVTTTMLVVKMGVAHAPGNGQLTNTLTGKSRARSRSALYDVLPKCLAQCEESASLYATQLEACAAAYSDNNYMLYMSMMSRMVFNIKSNGDRIVCAYPISRMCRLSHKRLRADTVHAQRDAAVELRLMNLLARAEDAANKASETASSVHTDTSIRCPKCKTNNDITRVLAQLQRGDEGMTTRCMCRCGHTWNMAS